MVGPTETDDTFTDNDISAARLPGGKAKERPAFAALLAAVERGEVDVIVCRDLARWTRDPLQGMTLLSDTWPEAAKRNGRLQVWYFGEEDYGLGIDFATGRGIKEARRSLNVAVEYVETLQKNTKTAKKRHIREGRPSGGVIPFGYRQGEYVPIGRDKGYWTRKIDPVEGNLIKQAVSDVLDGKTAYAIACEWTADGVATHGKAKRWQAVSVRRVLTTPSVAGLMTHGREVAIDDDDGQFEKAKAWEAIIPVEQWQTVCGQLTKNAASFTSVRPLKRSYLLRGVLVCGDCGRHLIGGGGAKMKTAYQCKSGSLLPGCGLCVSAAWIEAVVTYKVIAMLDDPAMLDAVHTVTEAEQAEAKQLRADNDADQRMISELAANTTPETLAFDRAASATAQKRIAERSERITGIRGTSLLDRYAGKGSEWETSTFGADEQERKDTHRAVISALIESVTVNRAKRIGGRLPDLKIALTGHEGLSSQDPEILDEMTERYFAQLDALNERVHVKWRYPAIEPWLNALPMVYRERFRKEMTT